MVVDKFGRQYGVKKSVRGPPGIGFKLTVNGDFNVEQRKISNVADPVDNFDAVNRQSALILEESSVNMRKRRLVELKDPINDSDGVTKKFAHNLMKTGLEKRTKEVNKKFHAYDVKFVQFLTDNMTLIDKSKKEGLIYIEKKLTDEIQEIMQKIQDSHNRVDQFQTSVTGLINSTKIDKTQLEKKSHEIDEKIASLNSYIEHLSGNITEIVAATTAFCSMFLNVYNLMATPKQLKIPKIASDIVELGQLSGSVPTIKPPK